MVLADFLGWNGQEWRDTFGIAVVFFVAFPILIQGLIAYAVAQALGERQDNLRHARGEDLGSSQG
jgi:hypothetical protein